MDKIVKISLALFMAFSMVASGLGVDIYYHYCGHTGDRHTSIYFKADCGPEENSHNSQSCCGINPTAGQPAESCCHSHAAPEVHTACSTLAAQCSDEYQHHSEEIVSTLNSGNDFDFIVACDIIRTNPAFNHRLDKTELVRYIAQKTPLINSPYKKLYIFISMRISPAEPADIA